MRSHSWRDGPAHRRSRPVDYALDTRCYYLALDLDELDEVDARSPPSAGTDATS